MGSFVEQEEGLSDGPAFATTLKIAITPVTTAAATQDLGSTAASTEDPETTVAATVEETTNAAVTGAARSKSKWELSRLGVTGNDDGVKTTLPPAWVPTTAPRLQASGVLHILFLVHDALPHAQIWADWLSAAPKGMTTLWMHCVDLPACEQSNIRRVLPDINLLPETEPSSHCVDLLSPAVRVLSEALKCHESRNLTNERFVLLSDSALPTKPFAVVFNTLMEDGNSGLCAFYEWPHASPSFADGVSIALFKTTQWFLLRREQAIRLVENWLPGPGVVVPSKTGDYIFFEPGFTRKLGCVDEMVPFWLMYGFDADQAQKIYRSSTCTTWTTWNDDDLLKTMHKAHYIPASGYHPVEFKKLTLGEMEKFFRHPAPFARKFHREGNFNSYSSFVFRLPKTTGPRQPAPALQCTAQASPRSGFTVHFLFTLKGTMPPTTFQYWKRFLASAPKNCSWQAWALCTSNNSDCGQRSSEEEPFWTWITPTTVSDCRDWFSANVQLIKAAVGSEAFAESKFVLLSGEFLPIRSAKEVFEMLKAAPGRFSISDWCLGEPNTWRKLSDSPKVLLARHSQWVVLNRRDARKLTTVWKHPETDEEARIHLWTERGLQKTKSNLPLTLIEMHDRCLAQSAPYAVLYGTWPMAPHATHPMLDEVLMPSHTNADDLRQHSRCRVFDIRESFNQPGFPSTKDWIEAMKSSEDVEFEPTAEGDSQSIKILGPRALKLLGEGTSYLFVGPLHEQADLGVFENLLTE